jgi:hypothetical protein
MIVWTPKNPARYNGTTVVEWADVSDAATYELTVELNYESQMLLLDQGYAFRTGQHATGRGVREKSGDRFVFSDVARRC